jgi:sialidase-1
LSGDGGQTWPDIRDVPELVEPSCMAALLRINELTAGAPSRIIYSGPFGRGRTNGTVHVSYDDGETWPVKKTIYPGRFAYSGLIALPEGILGCLFERGEKDAYERITLARFSFDWLSQAKKP